MNKPVCSFILGNGFSQGFGFPGWQQLWDDCLRPSPKLHDTKSYFESHLNNYPLSYFIKNNITDIELLLSVWSLYISNCENMNPDEKMTPNLNNEISGRGHYESYIENLCGHLLEYGDKAIKSPIYSEFRQWLPKKMSFYEFRFITLNYDLLLERVLSSLRKNIIYLGDTVDDNSIFMRKLHGSVNWLHSDTGTLQRQDGWEPSIIWDDEDGYIYNVNDDYSNVPYIAFASPPVLIPPLLNKEYTAIFKKLLGLAFSDLQKASFVILIGYSLPMADIIIRKFLEDVSNSYASKWSRFVYINPNREHCESAIKLLGNKVDIICDEWCISNFENILKGKIGTDTY